MAIKCNNCGTMLPDTVNFCTECGTKLDKVEETKSTCSNCGSELREGANFCVECGSVQTQENNIDGEVSDSYITANVNVKKKNWINILLIVVITLVVSIFCYNKFIENEAYEEDVAMSEETVNNTKEYSRYTEREEAENRLYWIMNSQHLRKEYFTLYTLYTDYIFGSGDFSLIARKVCSPELLKQLRDEYEYDCEDNECYAVWLFRTNSQDGTNVTELKSIERTEADWYKVNYIDMGHEGTTYIELSVDENWNVIMTGLRPDASYK